MTATAVRPDFLRGSGFFNPAENEHASYTQVGVGGIGSFAAFAVAKMGVPNLTLIDPDLVEPHNLPNQMFDVAQADLHKAGACADNVLMVNPDANVNWHVARIEADGWQAGDGSTIAPFNGVVASGLDSMTARHDLWHHGGLKMNPMVPLYIDARLDGQSVVIYAIRPWDLDDVEQYERTLKSDDEVPAGSCTERAIIDVGFTVGAQMARMVRRFYADEPIDKITVIDASSNRIMSGGWLPS